RRQQILLNRKVFICRGFASEARAKATRIGSCKTLAAFAGAARRQAQGLEPVETASSTPTPDASILQITILDAREYRNIVVDHSSYVNISMLPQKMTKHRHKKAPLDLRTGLFEINTLKATAYSKECAPSLRGIFTILSFANVGTPFS
ncbi:Unannotated, partial [Lentimonas sp. CC6]